VWGAGSGTRGKKVAVFTKMALKDENILDSIRKMELGFMPSGYGNTFMKVVHATANVDERQIFQLTNAGFSLWMICQC